MAVNLKSEMAIVSSFVVDSGFVKIKRRKQFYVALDVFTNECFVLMNHSLCPIGFRLYSVQIDGEDLLISFEKDTR